jgi:hypothetical protein
MGVADSRPGAAIIADFRRRRALVPAFRRVYSRFSWIYRHIGL